MGKLNVNLDSGLPSHLSTEAIRSCLGWRNGGFVSLSTTAPILHLTSEIS